MTVRVLPKPDLLVEIDTPGRSGAGIHVLTRRIVTCRDHGDGRWTCLLVDPVAGELSTATIAPAQTGQWICVESPVSVDGAIHVAKANMAGITLHRSVNDQVLLLSKAVLFLTGQHRTDGTPVAARIAGGRP